MTQVELVAVVTSAAVSVSNFVLILLARMDMKEIHRDLVKIHERLAVLETKLGLPLVKP